MAAPALLVLRQRRLPEVKELLGLRPQRRVSPPTASPAADAVNRASVVLLTAHLEGFVEDLVVDVCDALDRAEPPTTSIPTILLATHVLPAVVGIAEMTHRQKRADRVKALIHDGASLYLAPQLARGHLKADFITSDFGNPGSEAIALQWRHLALDARPPLQGPPSAREGPDGTTQEPLRPSRDSTRSAAHHGTPGASRGYGVAR